MGYYPVYLNIKNRDCVVIGSGTEAERKVEGLLEADANVKVITPHPSKGLLGPASEGRIVLHRRRYTEGDLKGVFLAVAVTTDDTELSQRIAAEAEKEGVLLNVTDVTHLCTWIAPAIVRRGNLSVAISTSGLSPAMARFVREELEQTLPEEFGSLLNVLAEVRQELRSRGIRPSPSKWQKALRKEIGGQLAAGDLKSLKYHLTAYLDPEFFSQNGKGPSETSSSPIQEREG